MKSMRIPLVLALSAVVVVPLAGCDGAATSKSVVTVTATATAKPSDASLDAMADPAGDLSTPPSGSQSDTQADDSTGIKVVQFGSTYSLGGFSVSVSKPVRYVPQSYAAGTDGHNSFRAMTITLKNTSTSKAVDPNMLNVSTTIGEVDGDGIYDDNVGGSPSAAVLPGRSVTWKIAYPAKKGDQVTVQIGEFMGSTTAAFDGVAG